MLSMRQKEPTQDIIKLLAEENDGEGSYIGVVSQLHTDTKI